MRIIGDKNIKGAPDLVIEILSESTAKRDLKQKKMLYIKFGVKEFWVVSPVEKTVNIFNLRDKSYELYKTYEETDVLESQLLKGFKMELKGIFRQL